MRARYFMPQAETDSAISQIRCGIWKWVEVEGIKTFCHFPAQLTDKKEVNFKGKMIRTLLKRA